MIIFDIETYSIVLMVESVVAHARTDLELRLPWNMDEGSGIKVTGSVCCVAVKRKRLGRAYS